MKLAIENFVKSRNNGLMLLNPPTGYGKTYIAFDYIASQDYDSSDTKKVIFITPYKKNLQESELQDAFIRHGNKAQYDKYFMFVDNKIDSARQNYEKIKDGHIHFEHKSYPIPVSFLEFQPFLNAIKLSGLIKKYQNKKPESAVEDSAAFNEILKIRRQEFSDANNAVQKKISKLLGDFKTTSEKLDLIKNDKEYKWIGFLYPEVFLSEKKILFMSVDKFLYGIPSILEKPVNYTSIEFLTNTLLFIDEFDDSKTTFLKYCCEQSLSNCKNIDFINLFNRINSCISNKRFDDTYRTDKCKEQFDRLKTEFSNTYKMFSLKFDLKSKNTNYDRNFLFDDGSFMTVSADSAKIYPKVNKHNKSIDLVFEKKDAKKINQDFSLIYMLAKIRYCINSFVIFCRQSAQEYCSYHEKKDGAKTINQSSTFTLDDAIRSVVRDFEFGQNSNEYNYLVALIKDETPKYSNISSKKKDAITGFIDRSVYSAGFRYFNFIDADDHVFQTIFTLHDMYTSPEKILINVAKTSNVIGLSATALIKSCIGNFDLDYLSEVLKRDFYKISSKDKKRIDSSIKQHLEKYEGINIKAEKIGCDSCSDAEVIARELKALIKDRNTANGLAQELNTNFKDDFDIKRIIKVSKSIYKFLSDDSLMSMIAFIPKLLKKSTDEYRMIIKILRETYDCKDSIVCLQTENFDREFKAVQKRLLSGKKTCVLTSYNSLGSGQNLTYKAPEVILDSLVKTFDRPNKDHMKDFDCVYFEKPTNVVPNLFSDKFDESDALISLFMLEACREIGELSQKDCWKGVRICLLSFNNVFGWKNKLMETESYNNASIRIIIQALGRIVRTNLKNKKIRIYADEALINKLDLSNSLTDYYQTEEMKALCAISSCSADISAFTNKTLNKQLRDSLVGIQNINNFLRRTWTQEYIEGWRKIREISLKHPTISDNEAERTPFQHGMYITFDKPVNSYSFEKKDDFRYIKDIQVNDSLSFRVSENVVKLPELIKIKFINDLFDEMGYAKRFKKNERILSPILFNNIYKGALGEAIGYRYFEKYLDVKLQELDVSKYEKFDNKYDDNIYIDFKFWNEFDQVPQKEQHEKIIEKLNDCNGKAVLIVNTSISNKKFKMKTSCYGDKTIYEIPCIYKAVGESLSVDIHVVEKIREILKKESNYEQDKH